VTWVFNDFELFWSQFCRLEQDTIGYSDLSDIVKGGEPKYLSYELRGDFGEGFG